MDKKVKEYRDNKVRKMIAKHPDKVEIIVKLKNIFKLKIDESAELKNYSNDIGS